ncbi:unnamed protein product [Clavelina lepadiformis]|uniref:Taste receptor type 2 n=1 Tax=Clavelina lepadiformis TaxID=159417 RepID=A0ABP0GPP9_CLALP
MPPLLVWNQSSVTSSSTTTELIAVYVCQNHLLSSKILAVLLQMVSLYIVTTLAIFSWKTRNRKNVSKLNNVCLLSAILAFLFCTSILFSLLPRFPYSTMNYINAACYWAGMSLTYTILWARQRRFYSNKLLANKVGKCHRILSSAVIIAICVCLGALVFTFVSKIDGKTCATSYDINDILLILVGFITAAFAFQILLFYLLVNPLRSEDGVKVSDIICFKLKKDIHKMIVRLAFCATMCIVTTMLTSGMTLLITMGTLQTSWFNMVTLDLIMNTISVVCSFKSWKTRLFPFCETGGVEHRNSEGKNDQISSRFLDT